MSNGKLENGRLRDREFDSELRESIETTNQQSAYALERQQAQCARPGQFYTTDADMRCEIVDVTRIEASPFAGAADAVRKANVATYTAFVNGDRGSAKAAINSAIETILEPYYTTRGGFEGARFLADLAILKGEPLSVHDVAVFGRSAGLYAGKRLAQEVNDELEAATAKGARPAVIASIIARALRDVKESSNI